MQESRVIGASLAAVFLAVATTVADGAGIERVAWLQGCWEMHAANRTVEELWMAPRGGSMIGVGRTVADGKLVEFETVVLREDGDRLAYEAHPSGQPAAVFTSISMDGSKIVFENPAHDFPQRIGYERAGADVLNAWIEGTRGERARRIDFAYRRVACPGPGPR